MDALTSPQLEGNEAYYYNRFNTPLSPGLEEQYYRWLGEEALKNKRDMSNDQGSYDMRGYWLAHQNGGRGQSANGHYPDTYKKPNHITFSDQSQYSTPTTPGGQWDEVQPDKWQYTPSRFVKNLQTPARLADFFKRYEPNSLLVLE